MDLQKIKTNSCLFIFLFINFAFLVKYLSRVTSHYILFSLPIIAFYYTFWSYRIQFRTIFKKLKYLNIILIVFFILASKFIFMKIPYESLNVDRWSVITSFWDNFFRNDYVYFAKSNVGNPPGPMPFYFILALPFYLIRELGYFLYSRNRSFFVVIALQFKIKCSAIYVPNTNIVFGFLFMGSNLQK